MSILERMRSSADSSFTQVIVILAIVSFIGWGVGMQGDKAQVVATVNGEDINHVEFSRAYRNAEQRMEQGRKEPMSQDDRDALRERVVQDLIRRRALLQEASHMGLEVSDNEVAKYVLESGVGKDADGKFDPEVYKNFLRRIGTTRGDFEEQIRDELLMRKLESLMQLGASVSAPMVDANYVEENTQFDLEYYRIKDRQFRIDVEPTPEQIATWIEEHPDDLQRRYDADFERKYDKPERYTATVIELDMKYADEGEALLAEKLEALRARIEAGEDMGELAALWDETRFAMEGGRRVENEVGREAEAVQNAIAELEIGELSEPIVTPKDVRIMRLEERHPAAAIPLEEVQEEIATAAIQEAESSDLAVAFTESFFASWKDDGEPDAEMTERKYLKPESTGMIKATGEGLGFIKPPPEMLREAANTPVGEFLSEMYTSDDGTHWIGRVKAREEADMDELETNRSRYEEFALWNRRSEFYQGWVDAVVAKADVER